MQILNGITSGGFNAKAEQVSVPFGLKSITDNVQLQLTVHNSRNERVYVWWVDYSGNPVLYGSISPGRTFHENTYGTHPWLVTDSSDNPISLVIPYESNMYLAIA